MKDSFNIVIFVNEPINSVNKQANIRKMFNGNYHIVNANMPYMGTINTIWTEEELQEKLRNKEILLKVI